MTRRRRRQDGERRTSWPDPIRGWSAASVTVGWVVAALGLFSAASTALTGVVSWIGIGWYAGATSAGIGWLVVPFVFWSVFAAAWCLASARAKRGRPLLLRVSAALTVPALGAATVLAPVSPIHLAGLLAALSVVAEGLFHLHAPPGPVVPSDSPGLRIGPPLRQGPGRPGTAAVGTGPVDTGSVGAGPVDEVATPLPSRPTLPPAQTPPPPPGLSSWPEPVDGLARFAVWAGRAMGIISLLGMLLVATTVFLLVAFSGGRGQGPLVIVLLGAVVGGVLLVVLWFGAARRAVVGDPGRLRVLAVVGWVIGAWTTLLRPNGVSVAALLSTSVILGQWVSGTVRPPQARPSRSRPFDPTDARSGPPPRDAMVARRPDGAGADGVDRAQ